MTLNPAPEAPATKAPAPDGRSLSASDPRMPFAQAVSLAGTVLARVTPDQLDRPTPCADFDVRQLCGHLVSVLRRVAAVGRGEEPLSVTDIADAREDGLVAAWTEAARDVEEVWSQPDILGRTMKLPFATLPGSVTMVVYTAEVTIHTWDLATATDQQPGWDDVVVAGSLAALERLLPEDRGPEIPFAPVVSVADDAPLIDRLAAWSGRRP